MTQEMCIRAFDNNPPAIKCIPDGYKTEEVFDKIISKNPFVLRYCADKYRTQKSVMKLLMIFCQH